MRTKPVVIIASIVLIIMIGLVLIYLQNPYFSTTESATSSQEIPQTETKVPSHKTTYSEHITPPKQNQQPASISLDPWHALQVKTPHPYLTPLPHSIRNDIDGVYAKLNPSWPQWWQCRRCADYRPAGGIWKLQFDKGVMRIYYDVTGWNSIASYTVTDDRLFLFNDPYCPNEVGEYRFWLVDKWGLQDRLLYLEVIEDHCSIDLRGKNLMEQLWNSCFPPDVMTGASDHWHKPPGCESPDQNILSSGSPEDLDVSVHVHQGYARDFTKQPDVYADANSDESAAPHGILILNSPKSIPYGLNRVLYGKADWIEAATELSFEAMGVQIYGDDTIGWARVLFDEHEVWRGNTKEIWSKFGRFGGYIEISDYEPGYHTLRVESLGFDYHPVTIAYFGFSKQGGVKQ
jgi:hypothetical protein